MEELWKANRKDQQLGNEVYLLKQAFCRVSKRLVLVENFLKNKFIDEFPSASLGCLSINTTSAKTKPSAAKTSSKLKTKTARTYKSRSFLSDKNADQPTQISKNPPPTDIKEVFLIDSEGRPIDWESNVITEGDVNTTSPNLTLSNNYNHPQCDETQDMQTVGLSVRSEVEMKNQENDNILEDEQEDSEREQEDHSSDMEFKPQDDQPQCPSPGYEVEIDKTNEDAANWLIGEDDSDHSISTDDGNEAKKKGRNQKTRKRPTNSSLTCTICNRVFNGSQAKNNLKSHMDIHSAVRKYKCTLCDKTFRQRRPLRTHIQRVHQFEKYAVNLCQYCGKKFVTPREKLHHEQTHTGEKPHTCEICGFSCIQLYNLVRHKESHSSKKDVLCPECGKSFTNTQHLRAHNKNIHQVQVGPDGKRLKEVICEICSAAFFSISGRRTHMYKIHGIRPQSIKQPKPQYLIIVNEDNPELLKETTEAVESIPSE